MKLKKSKKNSISSLHPYKRQEIAKMRTKEWKNALNTHDASIWPLENTFKGLAEYMSLSDKYYDEYIPSSERQNKWRQNEYKRRVLYRKNYFAGMAAIGKAGQKDRKNGGMNTIAYKQNMRKR